MQTTFRYRLAWSDGDIRSHFWSGYLVSRRLWRGRDSAGRRLVKCPIGRILF